MFSCEEVETERGRREEGGRERGEREAEGHRERRESVCAKGTLLDVRAYS